MNIVSKEYAGARTCAKSHRRNRSDVREPRKLLVALCHARFEERRRKRVVVASGFYYSRRWCRRDVQGSAVGVLPSSQSLFRSPLRER